MQISTHTFFRSRCCFCCCAVVFVVVAAAAVAIVGVNAAAFIAGSDTVVDTLAHATRNICLIVFTSDHQTFAVHLGSDGMSFGVSIMT